jgi:hypothetical protein
MDGRIGAIPALNQWLPLGRNELLIFFQSALIPLAGDPGCSANDDARPDQEFPEFSHAVLPAILRWDWRRSFGLPAYRQVASRYNSAAVGSRITLIGTRKEND